MELREDSLSIHGEVAPGWERIREYLLKHFPKQEGLGGALCVHHAGQVVVDVWMGQSSKNADWHPDKPVDMGSAVVGIGTLCLLLLRRRGVVDLDENVTEYWPDFAHDDIKVRDLVSGDAKVSGGTTWWCISELVRLADPAQRTIDVFVAEELLPSLNLDEQAVLTIPEPSSPSAPIHWAGATSRSLAAIYTAFMEMASINTDMPRRCAVVGSGGTHALFDVETEVAYAFLTNNSGHDDQNVVAKDSLFLRDLVSNIVRELNQVDLTRSMGFDDAESSPQDHDVSRVMSRTSTSIQTFVKSETSFAKTVTGLLAPKEPSPTCPFCIELGGFCGRCSQWRQTLLDDIIHEPEVLRGVPASTVMWKMGYWIRSGSKPSDEEGQKMHKLSFPVTTITRFLSHSWHANASIKVMALMTFFNGQMASIAGLLFAFLVSIMQRAGALPTLAVRWNPDNGLPIFSKNSEFDTTEVFDEMFSCPWLETRGCYCMIAYLIGYYTVFLFGSRMRDRAATTYDEKHPELPDKQLKTAFLDKLCIHQTDPIKKQKGINAIGAFLIKSERVTILWDATYFTRLWCVFEVAVFRRLNPGAIIEFVPITLGRLELWMHFAVAFGCLIMAFEVVRRPQRPMYYLMARAKIHDGEIADREDDSGNYDPANYFNELFWNTLVPGCLFYTWRAHVKSLYAVPKILAQFSARKANCFSETDRKFVESVIVALYDSLENFDEHVRGSMAAKLNGTVGTDCTPMLSFTMLYRAICAPMFVCVGLDYGLFWDLNTMPSLLITLLLTFPAFLCLLSRIFSLLPNMHWFPEIVLNLFLWFYTTGVNDLWRATLFESMRWGTMRRLRGVSSVAIHGPVDLPVVLTFGLMYTMDKAWGKIPRTDKGLREKTEDATMAKRPSLY